VGPGRPLPIDPQWVWSDWRAGLSFYPFLSRSASGRATGRGPSCAEGDRAGLRSGGPAARGVDRVHGPPKRRERFPSIAARRVRRGRCGLGLPVFGWSDALLRRLGRAVFDCFFPEMVTRIKDCCRLKD
jgi:hypothetical protein